MAADDRLLAVRVRALARRYDDAAAEPDQIGSLRRAYETDARTLHEAADVLEGRDGW